MGPPFTFTIPLPLAIPSRSDNHIQRRLSDLQGQFSDPVAYESALAERDKLVYGVYEIRWPELAGELLVGISIVLPGKVGREFFMTKGHFHTIVGTAEVYYVLKGEGFMVMETPEGDASVEGERGIEILDNPRWRR